MTEHYDRSFYAALNEASDESAARILSIVLDLAPSASAVDVGCGIGIWAQTLQRLGVKDVLAIDGDYIPRDQLRIDARNFQAHDISRSFDLGRTFDLAVCVEVAEHLDGNRADGFIADLVRLAPVIVFSAAAPRQGGVHHVNEQWPDYWIDRFNEQGYSCWDALRPQIRYNPNVAWIYRQNVILAIGPGSSLLDCSRFISRTADTRARGRCFRLCGALHP